METINIETHPLHDPKSQVYKALVKKCRTDLNEHGLFNLPGFMRPEALNKVLKQIKPIIAKDAFEHRRHHNIYFKKSIPGLEKNHPALQSLQTINHSICADQIEGSPITKLYDWDPLASFLADVMHKDTLHKMDDRIAGANVMTYYEGEALSWHFDRSEFTTTLLLQAPNSGGEFEYLQDLRSPDSPNYTGVAALLSGKLQTSICPQTAGTLNVFKGVNLNRGQLFF